MASSLGSWVGTTDHALPSKASTSVLEVPVGVPWSPTAAQNVGVGQDTATRPLTVGTGANDGAAVHEVPS